MPRMILKSLPVNFLDLPTSECIHLLGIYKGCPDINHTEFLIARQLLLQRLINELHSCIDFAINYKIQSDDCCVTFYRGDYPKLRNHTLEPGEHHGTN